LITALINLPTTASHVAGNSKIETSCRHLDDYAKQKCANVLFDRSLVYRSHHLGANNETIVERIYNEQELLTSHIPMISYEFNGIENLARSLTLAKLHTTSMRARTRLNSKIHHAVSDARCIIEEKRKKTPRGSRTHPPIKFFVELVDRETERIFVCFAFPDHQITSWWSANANDTQFRLLRIA
jgi:cephalosporin hydroxylase